jgi:hypothetical protein
MSDPHCKPCSMFLDEQCHGHLDPNICRNCAAGHGAAMRTANEVLYQGRHRGREGKPRVALGVDQRALAKG